MVQVDVFWGYAWGASLAAAAGRRLARLEKPYESKYWARTILFLAIFWAPTGLLLLLRHPSWETMQAAGSFGSMSEWLVLGFGVTNVTQGLLGFAVGRRLVAAGRHHAAQLNWLAGYFGMFFILLYGWDGLGYDRFLYDRDLFPGSPAWTPGAGTAAGIAASFLRFLGSPVAMTLYLDGVWLLPPFAYWYYTWLRESARQDGLPVPGPGKVAAAYLGAVFAIGLGGAAVTALAVRGVAWALGIADQVARATGQAPAATGAHVAAYALGIPIGAFVFWFALLRPGRPLAAILAPLELSSDRREA